jgi:glutathione S-transferase
MKLYYAPSSPFARKVRVLIAENGLANIDEEAVNPFDLPAALVAANPLSKVPSLVRDDGSVLYDSPVICEYLDSVSGGARLIPVDGAARWAVLGRQALADGLMETTLSLALETNRRPENERSPQWIARWCATIRRTVAVLDSRIADIGSGMDLGAIATACALAYLDLRAAQHVDWRTGHNELSDWFAMFANRPSMRSTEPA